jgi:dihydrofolate reductase
MTSETTWRTKFASPLRKWMWTSILAHRRSGPGPASTKPEEVTNWTNSQVISGDVASEIQKLKNQPEKISSPLRRGEHCAVLHGIGLLDEYRLVLNPALLGGGTPLFKPGRERVGLTLLRTRKFASGAVLLVYAPMK